MKQLITDTEDAASRLFIGLPLRVWYMKLDEGVWKTIIINTDNKIKLAVGPNKSTAEASLKAILKQLESIVGKKKVSP